MLPQLRDAIERESDRITGNFSEPRAVRIFFKALVIFTAIKIMLLIDVSRTLINYHTPSLLKSTMGRILLAPAYFAYEHPNIFFGVALCFLLVLLFIQSTYVTNILFFWLTLNLYAINLPIANGSDIVLFMLSLWCIPMVDSHELDDNKKAVIRRLCFNLAVIFCQIQVACLYFVSGWDKIFNAHWRTGEALVYIQHLEILYNPILPDFLTSPVSNAVFAWGTIVFELTFALLIWREKTRPFLLIAGTVFHLFIWIVLSLPDFAGIMIISYLIFIKDKDLERLTKFNFRRSLP